MSQFLQYTLIGLVTGGLYAVAASGLVLTYTTSGIFNFAHGAFGMLAAYAYWQLRVDWHLPAPIALIAVLFILAPLFGAGIERVIMRGLKNVSEVTKLVVSVSLLFGVTQVAAIVWPDDVGRRLPGFFEGNSIHLGNVYDMSWHEAIILISAVATAVALRFLLFGTRNGLAMRAVVDDRQLTQLNGARPDRSSMMAWAIGAMLAGLAGILLAASQGALAQLPLTLLVINAYGAALFGRLRSLPLTFAGAFALGLAQSYLVGYVRLDTPLTSVARITLPDALSISGLRSAAPIIALFVVLLFLPALKVRAGGQERSREIIPNPGVRRWLLGTVALGVLAFGYATLYPERVFQVGQGMALGIVMLSLVPLIGYGGQISLAPLAFAGVGAIVMGAWGGNGNPLALLAAIAIAGAVGAVVALPAIRLQGLYLALATAAFAVLMDYLVFNQNAFMPNGSLTVPRLDFFGMSALSFDDPRAHLVLLGVVFGLVATVIVWMRGRRFGRRLLAMKSSEAACVTLGVDLAVTKLAVFSLSAAIAGLGGALYAAQLNSVSPPTFQFLQNLPIVFLAVIGGIGAVGGALFGGLAYAIFFFIIPDVFPSIKNLAAVAPAFAGISLGRNPNGAVNETVTRFRERMADRARRAERPQPAEETDPSRLGLDGFTTADRRMLDEGLGLDDQPLYGSLLRLRQQTEAGSRG